MDYSFLLQLNIFEQFLNGWKFYKSNIEFENKVKHSIGKYKEYFDFLIKSKKAKHFNNGIILICHMLKSMYIETL